MSVGIGHAEIEEVPIAVLDFETTGLTPGFDRVVEVCVVRREPGREPRVVLDTLVNPLRAVAGTEIHGITDEDVEEAPTFLQVAGDLLDAVSGCVVSAYNVYFDMRFLCSELQAVGVQAEPPHFCLMYMRPMLGLGGRCTLEEACRVHKIPYRAAHIAAQDVLASTRLLVLYLSVLAERRIHTYADMASLKSYKFTKSFACDPLLESGAYRVACGGEKLSRSSTPVALPVDDTKHRVGEYWDALKTVLADLEITDVEMEYVI